MVVDKCLNNVQQFVSMNVAQLAVFYAYNVLLILVLRLRQLLLMYWEKHVPLLTHMLICCDS
ncbi:hypothetical protein DERF_001972 [Dermatophagoides farinae]|uniref:Uncharacterized protein n=1 Tax=Dermatophagoides farinae TaxID=6954 RepID=A0A922LD59_DERFA|nr:hypothetical protein DERF_001972 [Dermatophagoides farinae]